MGNDINNMYGVFTLERQDLVDLTRRIAECIPKDFLKNKDKPVIIAVDGSFGCGKKIIADYGREAILGIEHDDVRFPEHDETITVKNEAFTRWDAFVNPFKKLLGIKNRVQSTIQTPITEHIINSNGVDVTCHGKAEFDEFVSAEHGQDQLEVSFINVAWGGGFYGTKGDPQDSYYEKHLKHRKAGGVVYVHNIDHDMAKPDIEIKLESGEGGSCLNGETRACANVGHALKGAIGAEQIAPFDRWARFVTVKFNNAAIEAQGQMLKILKEEFGFYALDHIAQDVLHPPEANESEREIPVIKVDTADFPLVKKHKHHLGASANISAVPAKKCYEITVSTPALS